MATLATVTLVGVGRATSGLSGLDVVAGYQAATGAVGAGDLFPLGGQYTLIRFKTTGTICIWTVKSPVLSNYGGTGDITVTLSATDEREILIKNDGRFDQGGGSAGYINCVPSTLTGAPQVACKVIP